MDAYSATEVFSEKTRERYNESIKAFRARGVDVLELHRKDRDAALVVARSGDSIVAVCVARPDAIRRDLARLEVLSALSDEHRTGAFCAILQNLHDRGYFSFVRKPADDEEHAFLVGPMRFEAKGGPPEWLCGFSVY